MPTFNTNEALRSGPARVIPTGTVTVTFTVTPGATATSDTINLVKVPAGATITDCSFATSIGKAALKASVGHFYTNSADVLTTAAGSIIPTPAAANLITVAGDRISAAPGIATNAAAGPVTVPDDANSDATVFATLTGATGPALAVYSGAVTYTLQTQERFVAGS